MKQHWLSGEEYRKLHLSVRLAEIGMEMRNELYDVLERLREPPPLLTNEEWLLLRSHINGADDGFGDESRRIRAHRVINRLRDPREPIPEWAKLPLLNTSDPED